MRAEKNHDSQKLNIVALGIPVSGDLSIFIQDYLVQQYCINPGELINVRRLTSCPNSTPSQNPPLALFTVSGFEVKKKNPSEII